MEFNRDEIHYLTEAGPVMLSFEKRRYDGGPEIEVIQYIEAQRAAQEAFAQFEWHESEVNHYFTEVSTQKAKALKTETQKIEATTAVANKKKRLLEACMTPFMQLAVGSVGVLTGILAAAAYTNSKEPAMVLKSQAVMRDSSWTFVQGIVSSVYLPVNLIKTAFAC